MSLMTMSQAIQKFGPTAKGRWDQEGSFCSLLELPEWVSSRWINSAAQPTRHIYCNKEMQPALLQALENVRERGLLDELKTFDGCYMIRCVRGIPGVPSWHTYAMAVDLNARENPLGGPVKFTPAFVQCFKDAGFRWGGDFHRVDGMHFQFGLG